MRPELGKIFIKDIRFSDKTRVEDGALYVNREEAEKLVLEDDKPIGCHADIARPGESVKITSIKDVIKPRVKTSDGEIPSGVIGEVGPQVGTGRTHALGGCCVVTVGKIVGFQEDVTDISGPAADYCPLPQTYNPYVVVEPADGLKTHVYERTVRMAGLEVAAYVSETARELEPNEITIHGTKSILEQVVTYPDLPKVGYIHMLQSQGLLRDTHYYGVDTKQSILIFMYPMEIMDGAIASGNCVVPRDKVTTYHHFHNPIIGDCYKYHGENTNFMGAILINENVFLAGEEHHSDTVARLCSRMGLDSVLITEGGYGNPDADLMMNCREVECVGTKVVLITGEFSGKDRKFQSPADVCREADALASCGRGNATLQFPATDRVIGTQGLVEVQIGGWDSCKGPDGSFEAEFQIIIAPTIVNGSNKLTARGY